MSEKSPELLKQLETVKRLLGGSLPPKLEHSATKQNATNKPNEHDSSDDSATTTGSASAEAMNTAAIEPKRLCKRAPLLYPPMTATTPYKPAQTIVIPVDSPPACDQDQRLTLHGIRYCPFTAVTRFPYKFIDKRHMQAVSSAFFDDGKIWEREWDLYHVWHEQAPADLPLLFVTEAQFLSLIVELNAAFPDLNWKPTRRTEDEGLVLSFPQAQPELQPLWLGTSHSRAELESLRDSAQSRVKSSCPDNPALQAFQATIDLASSAGKNKGKLGRDRKQASAFVRAQEMAKQINSAREYVGIVVSQTDEVTSAVEQLTIKHKVKQGPKDLSFDVIFVAIDCEAYERDHSKVTEIGLATLDTRELCAKAPGKCGEQWRCFIRGRHFRVGEHKHLVNKDFLVGCPDRFEFGKSEDVDLQRIPSILTSCFKPPFSAQDSERDEPSQSSEMEGGAQTEKPAEKRKIVLVGHDISQDITYCHQLGFSVLNRSSLVEVLDTAAMFRAYSGDANPRSLASIMLHFDIEAWNLHNAGNDAVYTLWALLAMCVERSAKKQATYHGDDAQESH